MKKILITGGPVYALLDDVKIISNIFQGGLMADFANQFSHEYDARITYLCSNFAKMPKQNPNLRVIKHQGFDDYVNKVTSIVPDMDAIILGAAVANLIPWKKIDGKFPSHDYKEDEPIPILFKIAPRVINMIKNRASKEAYLFGFKLLANAEHDDLIDAAYNVLLGSKAAAVFANDRKDLAKIYAVTKEKGEHPLERCQLCRWIWDIINDEYYHTEHEPIFRPNLDTLDKFTEIIYKQRYHFHLVGDNLFGTVAVRCKKEGGFITTCRGKKELKEWTYVQNVDHENRTVYVSERKATLNAPLLDMIFRNNDNVDTIIHYHEQIPELPTLNYAPPGTVRDSMRKVKSSFNIEGHGCFLLNGER